ncbi:MAG TPA: L-histidine N(alpha)-methyltransferase [Candidatus Saccharimonadales bacterium]|nr:L-histidine N(alpha)-methyltransferase [Candidatus Saccharimonadales bacterium]
MEAGSEEKTPQINDLIFKELIKRQFSVEGDTRTWNLADSKLWYLTDAQSQDYLNLEHQGDYKSSVTDKEVALLRQHVPDIISMLHNSHYNLIDLGCGDGTKAAAIIQDLTEKLKLRYCPIDISSYMVRAAAQTLRDTGFGDVVEFKWNVSDFENLTNITPLLREGKFQQHCMLLLGNTLGNFDTDDMLHGIKQSMRQGDTLVVGNGLRESDDDDDVTRPYQAKSLDEFLIHVLEQVGLSANDVEYNARFKNSRVEMYYKVKNNKTVNHFDKSVQFKSGDEILTAISYKFTKDSLGEYLKKFFPNVQIFTDSDTTYALALCS